MHTGHREVHGENIIASSTHSLRTHKNVSLDSQSRDAISQAVQQLRPAIWRTILCVFGQTHARPASYMRHRYYTGHCTHCPSQQRPMRVLEL